MLTASLGAIATGYTCTSGVCVGQTAAMQQAFFELQREINRVAAVFGISSRIANDGKIGKQTVGLLRQVAERAAARGPIDPALDNVLIEQDPASDARDVAAEAVAITAALQRASAPAPDGGTWGPVSSISTFLQDIIKAGQGAPASLPPGPTGIMPVPSSTTTFTPINPYPDVSAMPPASAAPPIIISTPWAAWQVAVGVGGGLLVLGTLLALAFQPRRTMAGGRLGCGCRGR